ncbi:protein BREVIS RADIX-like isoform X3 [Nymphaea colorata]|uniref:protein BREVIS RADIX-like isoform X3 n=1 Tax=Nymphaea colorata TaxID=210225 RepID=UPI00214E3AD3|nr:protein BREVIS RADIX-like isoform X3 [Nymphaea colorata]
MGHDLISSFQPLSLPRDQMGTKIKDMALRFSSAYRQCKPSTSSGSNSHRKGSHPFADLDAASESLNYGCQRTVSCSSTPAWDFHTSSNRDLGVLHDSSRTHNVGSLTGEAAVLDSMSSRSGEFILVQEDEPREWMAQVEPGVLITFVSLPQGGNDLKRIRFSREMFNKIQAQRWWGENYDRIMELYNVQRFSRQAVNLPTPPRSEDEQRDSMSRMGSAHDSPATQHLNRETYPRNFYRPPGKPYYSAEPTEAAHQFDAGSTSSPRFPNLGGKKETLSVDASRTTTSSRDEASVSLSNASDMENEWVEQDEPGVYITIRALPDGTRELRRVRFSRERFGEAHAKIWWEENRERIQSQYL